MPTEEATPAAGREQLRSGAEPKAVIDLLKTAEAHAFLEAAAAKAGEPNDG